MKGRYSIRHNKFTGIYTVYYNEWMPMYCGSFDTKEEAKQFIKQQRKQL